MAPTLRRFIRLLCALNVPKLCQPIIDSISTRQPSPPLRAVFPNLTRCFALIVFADYNVPIKHAARLVAAYRHRHPLMDIGAIHVSNRCAPEVVKYLTRKPGYFQRLVPCVAEVTDRLSIAVNDILANQSRGLTWNFGHLALIPLALNRFEQFTVQRDCPRLVDLG